MVEASPPGPAPTIARSASFNLFSLAQAFLRRYLAARSGKGLANPDIWHTVDDHDALMADANAAINPAWFMFLRSEPGNPNSCSEQNGGDRLSFVGENLAAIYFDFEPSASPCLYLYSSIWHHTVALLMWLRLVQHKIFTAKARRTQRRHFLFGGERPPTDVVGPPNKKSC
jgi:hypothetical protein